MQTVSACKHQMADAAHMPWQGTKVAVAAKLKVEAQNSSPWTRRDGDIAAG